MGSLRQPSGEVRRKNQAIEQGKKSGKNKKETGSDIESSKGFGAELRRFDQADGALTLCPVLAKSGH